MKFETIEKKPKGRKPDKNGNLVVYPMHVRINTAASIHMMDWGNVKLLFDKETKNIKLVKSDSGLLLSKTKRSTINFSISCPLVRHGTIPNKSRYALKRQTQNYLIFSLVK